MAKQAEQATPVNLDEQVAITHPDLDGNGLCTRRQFAEVWEPKGWTIVDDKSVEEVVAEQVAALSDVTTTNPEG